MMGWINVKDRLPKDNEAVNITWVNRKPVSYYANIKDKPFTATGVYNKGIWYWWSAIVQDYLDEYDEFEPDKIDESIEIIAWMPLPEPYKEQEICWIKCSDKMPDNTDDVLYCDNKSEIHCGFYNEKYNWWQSGSGVLKSCYVTHWMPLPFPPEDK